MSSKGIHKGNAGELKPLARTFLETYQAASVVSEEDARRILMGDGGYSQFEGGMVELTDQVSTATDNLVDKAIKMIGPKGANERALAGLAEEVGRDLIRGEIDLEAAVTKLIQSFAEEGNSSFEVILPNYLIDFRDGARSITIGRVRAALSDDVSAELGRRGINVEIKQGPQLSQSFRDRNLVLTFPRQCWVVNVAAARDNAQEEAKWLLDVAVSLLRMSYKVIGPMFPMAGDIEPHPSQTWQFKEGSV
jgi:hypothetical protein